MAVGGHADSQAGIHHRRDHPCAGVGFAAAGRSLDRQHPAVERERQAKRSAQGGLALIAQRLASDAGRVAQEQVSRSLIRSLALQTVIGHIFADSQPMHRRAPRADMVMGKQCFRVKVGRILRAS